MTEMRKALDLSGRLETIQEQARGISDGTALIRIDPAGDPRVHALGEEVQELVQRAEARIIASDADVRVATLDLGVLRGLMGAFEEKRKEFTGPLNGYLKDINAAFKEYTVPLERAWKMNEDKVKTFRAEQEAINRAREEANRLNEEAGRREMQLTGELSQSVGLVEVAPPPLAHYRTPAGTLGTVKTWAWEVVDFPLVPDLYKVLDTARVRKIIQAGGTIPGIRAWQEENLRLTR